LPHAIHWSLVWVPAVAVHDALDTQFEDEAALGRVAAGAGDSVVDRGIVDQRRPPGDEELVRPELLTQRIGVAVQRVVSAPPQVSLLGRDVQDERVQPPSVQDRRDRMDTRPTITTHRRQVSESRRRRIPLKIQHQKPAPIAGQFRLLRGKRSPISHQSSVISHQPMRQ
jgi:hypothetical protein